MNQVIADKPGRWGEGIADRSVLRKWVPAFAGMTIEGGGAAEDDVGDDDGRMGMTGFRGKSAAYKQKNSQLQSD